MSVFSKENKKIQDKNKTQCRECFEERITVMTNQGFVMTRLHCWYLFPPSILKKDIT